MARSLKKKNSVHLRHHLPLAHIYSFCEPPCDNAPGKGTADWFRPHTEAFLRGTGMFLGGLFLLRYEYWAFPQFFLPDSLLSSFFWKVTVI